MEFHSGFALIKLSNHFIEARRETYLGNAKADLAPASSSIHVLDDGVSVLALTMTKWMCVKGPPRVCVCVVCVSANSNQIANSLSSWSSSYAMQSSAKLLHICRLTFHICVHTWHMSSTNIVYIYRHSLACQQQLLPKDFAHYANVRAIKISSRT